MNLMLYMGLFILFLSNIMMFIAMILSKKSMWDREKITSFECGFDPSSSSRISFSLRFFLISIMFLIFDVEIVLLLPIINLLNNSDLYCWFMTSYFFILVLLFGLFYEWYKGALEWTN